MSRSYQVAALGFKSGQSDSRVQAVGHYNALLASLGRKSTLGLAGFIYLFIYFCLFAFSRAASMACGGSQARGLIRAAAIGLHQSHSNAGSGSSQQPTPQLTATLDS